MLAIAELYTITSSYIDFYRLDTYCLLFNRPMNIRRSMQTKWLSCLSRNQPLKWKRLVHSKVAATPSSKIQERLDYFSIISNGWWNPNGPAWINHQMTTFRISFIQNELSKSVVPKQGDKPLEGLRILDVGCGGGIVSEGLARLGAEVTGLDPCDNMIKIATHHSKLDPSSLPNLTYVLSTVEEHALRLREQYDVIVAFFVLEHITNRQEFINSCIHLLKPNGSFFIQHANRTYEMHLMYLWEIYVMGRLPKGLYKYHRLLKTADILKLLSKAGLYDVVGHCGLVKRIYADLCWTNSNKYWKILHLAKLP